MPWFTFIVITAVFGDLIASLLSSGRIPERCDAARQSVGLMVSRCGGRHLTGWPNVSVWQVI